MERRRFLLTSAASVAAAASLSLPATAFPNQNNAWHDAMIDRARNTQAIERELSERARSLVSRHGIFPEASFEIIAKPYEYRAVLDEALNLGTDLCMPVRVMAVYGSGQPVESIRIWKTQNGRSINFYRGPGHERYIEYDPTGLGFTRLKVSAGQQGRPVIVMYRVMRNMSCRDVARRNA